MIDRPIISSKKSVIVLSVYRGESIIWVTERYELYSKPKGFFKRLSKPDSAEYYHRKEQREFMAQSNVYDFVDSQTGITYYAEFNFETDDHMRNLIISKYADGKFKGVGFDD